MTTIANKTQSYDKAWSLTRRPGRCPVVALRQVCFADGGESRITLAYSADRGTSYTYRWDHHP